jgi:DNA damage-binding protein 2
MHVVFTYSGDSHGRVHFVDARSREPVAACQLHKKGNKVTSVHVNPRNCNLLLTASNDWTARLCDIRAMSSSVGPSSSGARCTFLPACKLCVQAAGIV